MDIDVVVIFTVILLVVSHAWRENLLSQLTNFLAGEPSSHGGLASHDDDEFVESVVSPVESLAIREVSPRGKLVVLVVVSSTAASLSHVRCFFGKFETIIKINNY